jgi:spermidine/putrescine transport system ATP-binding protein
MVMSDRIGVMRNGRLVQVGTPHEIYTAPRDKFVSEFMGDVNVIDVVADADGLVFAEAFGARLTAPEYRLAFQKGHLVIRPESMRFLNQPEEAENRFEGTLYNEYALGSRIQYQVRVGEHVFMVERLRQQAFTGRLDERVLIGWDSADSILVQD